MKALEDKALKMAQDSLEESTKLLERLKEEQTRNPGSTVPGPIEAMTAHVEHLESFIRKHSGDSGDGD